MKSITLHGMAPDNAGDFHSAGSTLTVSDERIAGCITTDRAQALVAAFAATVDDASGPPKAKTAKKRTK